MNDLENKTNDVRRKLLKAMVYAPPVILGSMVATPRTAIGAIGDPKTCKMNPVGGVATPSVMITISSGTNACCPCIPGSTKFDAVKCSESQCKKSCGVNCGPNPAATIATIKCKDFCKNCGPMASYAGCRQPCKSCLPDPKKPGRFKCK